LPDVSGPEAQVLAFAERWAQARGCEYRLECRYRWYAATQVLAPGRRPNGQLRLATPQDRDWVADWAAAYAAEVWSSAVDVPAFFDRRVSSRSLYVWEDGEPRAVAAVSGHTPNTARVSAVYAPERHRGGGYASQLVAEVTRAILSERRWSVLSADVQNISVNGLYARIGYRPVCETAAVAFDC
jgi:GNAT superfamily N-acetyltransferase